MPSPFPGMDPYLENPDIWPDVHHELIGAVREQLNSRLQSLNYVVRVELRTFVFEQDDPATELYVVPDARTVEQRGALTDAPSPLTAGGTAIAELTAAPSVDVTGLMIHKAQDRFLEIRDTTNRRVVTVIEIVSPSNKINGSAGRRTFLEKREEIAASESNWLEIDLLRKGSPSVNFTGVPRSAYRAYTDRTTTEERKQGLWPMRLRQLLPVLGVPLRPGEKDVALDLQAAFTSAYVVLVTIETWITPARPFRLWIRPMRLGRTVSCGRRG